MEKESYGMHYMIINLDDHDNYYYDDYDNDDKDYGGDYGDYNDGNDE